MLRVGVTSGKRLLLGPIGPHSRAQWIAKSKGQRKHLTVRWFADSSKPDTSGKSSILSSDPAFLPGSQSRELPKTPGTTGATPATPSSASSIPVENVPKAPPPPSASIQTAPPTTTSSGSSATASKPPPTPPAPKPKPRRSGLRFLLYLVTASGLAYAGGVFYALRNDNFHDFFTEYIPFGEDAVLYFEEQDFRRRFPHASAGAVKLPQARKDESSKVTIPSKSGLSWKVSDDEEGAGSDTSKRGRHMNALDANKGKQESAKNAQQAPQQEPAGSKSIAVEKAKGDASQKGKAAADTTKTVPMSESKEDTKAEPKRPNSKAETSASQSPPPDDQRQPIIPSVTQIPPLAIEHAEEPVVQELVKIINDIITVVNSDSADAANKYSAPLGKAKESLSGVGSKILALKDSAKKAASEEIASAHKEFDNGARELLKRIDAAREQDAIQFRQEFEAEREKLSQTYAEKVKNEVERYRELIDQQRKNEMAEQAIQLKQKFVSGVQDLVEKERDGRLSKLTELSDNVCELQKLTSDWNGVIDTNLATQKLQVAVEAVRSTLIRNANISGRPQPFVRELAALKEVANGDTIVDAAIASINPTAYQRGVPSSAALIDRFRRVASEVRKASLLPENAGFASHLASAMLSKVMFKKQGMAEGADVESILTRTETLLEEGDLDGAAREMNGLRGWAKVLSKDWLGDVRKVLEVRQALEVIETEARLQCLRVE